jgi:hypothetical protein
MQGRKLRPNEGLPAPTSNQVHHSRITAACQASTIDAEHTIKMAKHPLNFNSSPHIASTVLNVKLHFSPHDICMSHNPTS